MKTLVAILIPFFAVNPIGFINLTDPVHVTGKLTRQLNDKKQRSFEILVKGDDVVIGKTNTALSGDFELSFTPANERYFDFFFIDPKHKADTVFLMSFSNLKPGTINVVFQANRKYHVDDDNNVVCPKCGQSDNVKKGAAYYNCAKDKINF